MIERAIQIAVAGHAGQFDKAGQPYILHPLRVMFKQEAKSETYMVVAVLHDLLEDVPEWTLERLRAEGFSDEVLLALECLMRRHDESYKNYIKRCATNEIASSVKLADLRDNSDMSRLYVVGDSDLLRVKKYHEAWHMLTGKEMEP